MCECVCVCVAGLGLSLHIYIRIEAQQSFSFCRRSLIIVMQTRNGLALCLHTTVVSVVLPPAYSTVVVKPQLQSNYWQFLLTMEVAELVNI